MEIKKTVVRPKEWTEEEKLRLKNLAKRAVGASKIATDLGRHITSIKRMARELKVLLRK